MLWQLATSYLDYLSQLSALLRDPVYRGTNVPKGKGEPVLLVPGFLGGDWTLLVMAGWLKRTGYRPYLSGVDWNVDWPNRTGELLGRRLAYIVRETGSPVVVIGHSLGGLLARFLSSRFPESACHVVALGSPVHNPLDAAHPFVLSAFFTLQAWRETRGDSSPKSSNSFWGFIQRVSSPLPQGVGFTSIFSKQDEVVDWHACLDSRGENREVPGRHVSLIVNREVYRILAGVLITCSQGKDIRAAQGSIYESSPVCKSPSFIV